MKKTLAALLLAGCLLSLAACEKEPVPAPAAPAEETESASVQETAAPAEEPSAAPEAASEQDPVFTEQDLLAMYNAARKSEWEYLACVLTPDRANGCVGAVLYRDGETSIVSFFDEDCFAYRAGPVARTAEDPEFSYLGDGTVAFRLLTDSGEAYDYTLTLELSEDGSHANWTAKDTLAG